MCLGRCEAPGSLASCLSHAPQLSGVNAVSLFTWLRAFPSFSAITDGAGGRCVWKHPLDHSLGVCIPDLSGNVSAALDDMKNQVKAMSNENIPFWTPSSASEEIIS